MASPSQDDLAKLGRVNDKTVMVGFSAGRPHPLVVRAMKLARNRRAATIAIADATLSEVASWPTTGSTTRPTAPPSCAPMPRCWA